MVHATLNCTVSNLVQHFVLLKIAGQRKFMLDLRAIHFSISMENDAPLAFPQSFASRLPNQFATV
jgi:hypothetical protein